MKRLLLPGALAALTITTTARAAGVESPTLMIRTPSVSRLPPVLPMPMPSAGRSSSSLRVRRIAVRRRKSESLSAVFTFTVDVRYSGNPAPVSSRWGGLGWDELTDGALVASQPVGAPSWFPCNDHPSDKATYRIAVTTAARYTVAATGVLTARRRSAGRSWSAIR